MIGQISGIMLDRKNFISVCFNTLTGKYDIARNCYIKSIHAKVYDIDDDYDFGAIEPEDVAITMYIKESKKESGVTLRM